MKKFLAILLVIAMLLPYGMTVNAIASETETIETDPFYFVNISGNIPEDLSNVYHMPFFYSKTGQASVYYDGFDAPAGSGYGSYDIEWIALCLKDTFDNQPEGSRYIRFDMPAKIYGPLAENYVYIENATVAMRG